MPCQVFYQAAGHFLLNVIQGHAFVCRLFFREFLLPGSLTFLNVSKFCLFLIHSGFQSVLPKRPRCPVPTSQLDCV